MKNMSHSMATSPGTTETSNGGAAAATASASATSTTATRSRFRTTQTQIQVVCAPSTGEFHKCIDKFVGAAVAAKHTHTQHRSTATTSTTTTSTKTTATATNTKLGASAINVLIIRGSQNSSKSYDGGAQRVASIFAEAKRENRLAMPSATTTTTTNSAVIIFEGSIWDDVNGLLHHVVRGRPVHIICIDPASIHGNDLLGDSVAMVRLLQSLFRPTCTTILVKSRLLARHARSFHNVHNFINAAGDMRTTTTPRPRASTEVVHTTTTNTTTNLSSLFFQKTGDVQVVCAVGVESYRDSIPFVVQHGDHVLEIGCHHGKTTDLLAQASNVPHTVVGIDIGKLCIDRANQKYGPSGAAVVLGSRGSSSRNRQSSTRSGTDTTDPPGTQTTATTNATTSTTTTNNNNKRNMNIRFIVADAWDTGALLELDPHFNVIYLDVGGISGADGEFEALGLVRQLICAYAKNTTSASTNSNTNSNSSSLRCIVVKSRCLRDHAVAWCHSDNVLRDVDQILLHSNHHP